MKAPLQLRPFRRLIVAYGVNSVGTWLGEIAVSIFLIQKTHSAAVVAAFWVCAKFLPSLIGPLLVTRLDGRRAAVTLPALLAAEAGLFTLLAAVVASGFSLVAVLILAAADGLLGLAARALVKASIAATTEPRGLLREGNALLIVVFTGCMAVGPVLGGVTAGFGSPVVALLIDAASFALAALLLGPGSQLPRAGSEHAPAAGRLREGLEYVRASPALRSVLAASGAVMLLGAAILPIEVVLVTQTLGASYAAYGTVLALWGAGALLGSVLLPAVRRLPLRPLLAGSFAVYAVSYLGMGSAGSIGVVCGFSLLGGLSNGIEAYASMTAIQELTSETLQARIGGFVETLAVGATGVGFLAGGAIASFASARAVYAAAGIGIFAVTALLVGHRTIDTAAKALIQHIPRRGLGLASGAPRAT